MKTYKVNEIFYSVQGEGLHAGEAAVFIRLSGCNLRCHFCDTRHNDGKFMTASEICDAVEKYTEYGCSLLVITGGEPTLQLDNDLVGSLQDMGFYVAIETNGTREVPTLVDWVTVSPKEAWCGESAKVVLHDCSELKIVYTSREEFEKFDLKRISANHLYIQPCDTGDAEKNKKILQEVVNYVKKNPEWKISIQTQKILNVR